MYELLVGLKFSDRGGSDQGPAVVTVSSETGEWGRVARHGGSSPSWGGGREGGKHTLRGGMLGDILTTIFQRETSKYYE